MSYPLRFAMLIGSCLVAGPASAQFLTYQAGLFGLPTGNQIESARLDAMGGMRFVVPDENREVNLSDFGQNIAARARDKDQGWSVETGYIQINRDDDFVTSDGATDFEQRQAVRQEAGTALAAWANDSGRGLGGQVTWKAQRLSERVGVRSRTRGPNLSAYWNESVGPLALGIGLTRFSDNENLTSSDLFAVRHFSQLLRYSLGAIYSFAGIDWGAGLEIDHLTIEGRSRDTSGFHQDDFKWSRPTTRYRFAAFLPEGGDLELGANLVVFDLDGREEATISWSDRFPANPGGFDFERTLGTFEESESGFRFEARSIYWLGYAPRVGGFFAYEDRSSEVTESPNFIGSRREGSLDHSQVELGGGFGTSLLDEVVTLALEIDATLADITEVDRLGVSTDRSTQDVGARLGVEWFVRNNVALRAGYDWAAIDTDTDRPFSLRTGSGGSVGFGYLPRGGIFSVDGVIRYSDRNPADEGGENFETGGFEVGFYTRLLF